MYMYIYMCVCVHTLFLHAVVHVDESSSVFSISSPGDFISFPHLFDHFIKRIWSVIQIYLISLSHKKNMFPTYLFIISFGFISCPKFSQSISPVDHYSLSSVLQSVPNLLVHVIIGFHQFFPPISCVNHDVSWVLVVRSFIVSLDFHQSSSPKSSLYHSFSSVFPTCLWFFSQVTRFYAFSLTTWSFYHRRSSFLPIHSLIFSWDFNQYSLPICSSSHSVSSDFPTSWLISSLDFICFLHFFLWSVDFILFPSYCNVWCIIFI